MRAKRVKLVLLLAAALLASGCWDSRDIEERNIATLVIVDKTEDKYSFLIEYSKPSSGKKNGESERGYIFRKSEGASLIEAREAQDRELDNPGYLGATNAVIMTERFADSGIEEYVYRLRETNDYRKMVDVLITADEPASFAEVESEQSSVGAAIEGTMESLTKSGQMYDFHLSEILESLAGPCNCFLLPNVRISNNDLEISGFSVFRDGKRIGSISAEDSKGVLLLLVKQPEMYYRVPADGSEATVQIRLDKRSVQPSYQDGTIRFTIDCRFDGVLSNMSENTTVTEETGRQIAAALQEEIAQDIFTAVQMSQQTFQSDYLDFFNTFRIAYPVEFRNMDWCSEYPNAAVTIRVSVSLDTSGVLDFSPRNNF